jgi:hypothetical protein
MTEDFLRRWSRLKHESAEEEPADQAVAKKDDEPQVALPPLEQMTPQSDFRAFMQPKVEDALRRAALKKLFSDPHFNLPDPYEAYSGDWTVGEPIPEEMLATLNQARTVLFGGKGKQEEKEEEQAPAVAAEPQQQATGEQKQDEPRRQDA